MRYATRLERFEVGDYPMVCARSGLRADKLVPVEAARRASWPWVFFPLHLFTWLLAASSVQRDRMWGKLPFAAGHVEGIAATWDRRSKTVTLTGVHQKFIDACHEHQRQ